jgi:excisionase family DNA binding protein
VEDEMLTLKDVANETGYEMSTLRREAIKGTLKAKKFGNTWTVTRTALNEWLESDKRNPKKGPKGPKN